jgi:hypothetical protein
MPRYTETKPPQFLEIQPVFEPKGRSRCAEHGGEPRLLRLAMIRRRESRIVERQGALESQHNSPAQQDVVM